VTCDAFRHIELAFLLFFEIFNADMLLKLCEVANIEFTHYQFCFICCLLIGVDLSVHVC